MNGVEKLSGRGLLSFYPNPTTGLVKMAGASGPGLLEIYNVAGQMAKSEIVNNPADYQINLLQVKPGMYLVKYNTNATTYHGQIILRSKQ